MIRISSIAFYFLLFFNDFLIHTLDTWGLKHEKKGLVLKCEVLKLQGPSNAWIKTSCSKIKFSMHF